MERRSYSFQYSPPLLPLSLPFPSLYFSFPLFSPIIIPRVLRSKGLSNRVDICPSVCPLVEKNIENTNNQLKYVVIRSEKGTITMFELFFDGHSTDSVIYDLLQLQIQLFLISCYNSPAPPL